MWQKDPGTDWETQSQAHQEEVLAHVEVVVGSDRMGQRHNDLAALAQALAGFGDCNVVPLGLPEVDTCS